MLIDIAEIISAHINGDNLNSTQIQGIVFMLVSLSIYLACYIIVCPVGAILDLSKKSMGHGPTDN